MASAVTTMTSWAWAAEPLLIVAQPLLVRASPMASAWVSRSSTPRAAMDRPSASPTLVAADIESSELISAAHGARASLILSVWLASKASALIFTSRTTFPPASSVAVEIASTTAVGASGMATTATRMPLSTFSATTLPTRWS